MTGGRSWLILLNILHTKNEKIGWKEMFYNNAEARRFYIEEFF